MTSRIARTIFLTSVLAYVGFAFIDYVEPGVVSDVMSVHLWLLPIIASGIFWAIASKDVQTARWDVSRITISASLHLCISLLLGLAIGTIIWHNGNMFGDFRFLLALCGAALPTLAIWTASSAK